MPKSLCWIFLHFNYKNKRREVVVGQPFQLDMEIKKVSILDANAE